MVSTAQTSFTTILCGQHRSQDKVYAEVKANLHIRLGALEVGVGIIKALVASKEKKQEQKPMEKLIQAVNRAKRDEVCANRSFNAKKYRHQVSAEELRTFNARMPDNSRPGQLANNACIASEAAMSSVNNHDEASTPRIKSRQSLSKRERSRSLQSGSFISPPGEGSTHSQCEQCIPGSNDSAGCGAACMEAGQLANHKEDRPFPCSKCVDKFKKRDHLKGHKNVLH